MFFTKTPRSYIQGVTINNSLIWGLGLLCGIISRPSLRSSAVRTLIERYAWYCPIGMLCFPSHNLLNEAGMRVAYSVLWIWLSRSGIHKLWPMDQIQPAVFVNSFTGTKTSSFVYIFRWMLSHDNIIADYLWLRSHEPQSLKYLLSAPLGK